MKVKIVSVALLTGFLFACSSDDDEVVIDVTGDYTISTRSFTEFAANNVPCGDGEGTVTIADGTISGSVLSGEAQFNVTGTVESNGTVDGGFALSSETVANFEGSFTTDFVGFGSWVDNAGCNGAWQALMSL